MEENKAKILAAMKAANKPVRPGDIAKATGIESDVVSKIIKQLKDEGTIVSPKRCFYSPAN
ncbi:MarR family transcriptional regulator [candidate division KSB1 bacterium]|nr:MarR family transcriptional regulator [candidate division KSB1 bacterium]